MKHIVQAVAIAAGGLVAAVAITAGMAYGALQVVLGADSTEDE